jgi:hypothetical protein
MRDRVCEVVDLFGLSRHFAIPLPNVVVIGRPRLDGIEQRAREIEMKTELTDALFAAVEREHRPGPTAIRFEKPARPRLHAQPDVTVQLRRADQNRVQRPVSVAAGHVAQDGDERLA